MRAHLAQRHDHVARLERPRRRLGQERRVEHEVLERDDRRAASLRGAARRSCRRSLRRGSACRRVPRVAPRVMLTTMARQVAVIGSGAEWEGAAEEVGRLLAESGCTVITGGLGEVMAAAHRGAKSAGGTTIAILPGEDRAAANPWADHVVVTGIGHARNLAVAASGRRGDRGRRELRDARRDGARAAARPPGRRARRCARASTERSAPRAPAEAVELALRHLG